MGNVSVYFGDEVPPWAATIASKQEEMQTMLTLVLNNQEKIMTTQTVNTDALVAIAAKLKADDDNALAALKVLRDQNAALAAQLAALPPATDPAAQAVVDATVAQLTQTAADVEAGVAANPAVTNLPPVQTA